MTDFSLHPPGQPAATSAPYYGQSPEGPTARVERSAAQHKGMDKEPDGAELVKGLPQELLQPSRDEVAFSYPGLMAVSASPEANNAVRSCYELVRQPLPPGEKLAQLDELVRQADQSFSLRNNYAAGKEVSRAASTAAEQILNEAVDTLARDKSLTPEERQQQLQGLRGQLDALPWLSSETRSTARVKLSFGAGLQGAR